MEGGGNRREHLRGQKGWVLMNTGYVNPGLRQLRDQQVRFAPRDKKLQQAARAEKLLGELTPGKSYNYVDLCYRITDFKPEQYPDLKVTAEEARHDLRLFVEDVSAAAEVPADDAGEKVLTIEELAEMFNVFDAENGAVYDSSGATAAYAGDPLQGEQRLVQLGARFTF